MVFVRARRNRYDFVTPPKKKSSVDVLDARARHIRDIFEARAGRAARAAAASEAARAAAASEAAAAAHQPGKLRDERLYLGIRLILRERRGVPHAFLQRGHHAETAAGKASSRASGARRRCRLFPGLPRRLR